MVDANEGRAELEVIVTRLISVQQPFFQALTNQLESMEHRLSTLDLSVREISGVVTTLQAAELQQEISALDSRINILEADKHNRDGMATAIENLPKVVVYIAIIIAMVLGYLKMAGPAGVKFP